MTARVGTPQLWQTDGQLRLPERLSRLPVAPGLAGRTRVILAHNGTCTSYSGLLDDIQIAKGTGWEGIELIGSKLYRYLDNGGDLATLRLALDGITAVGIGYIPDIERCEGASQQALYAEAERLCSCAEALGVPMVQALTGPLAPGLKEPIPDYYQSIMQMSWPQRKQVTVANLKEISTIAGRHGVSIYLEALSWTPSNTLKHMLELVEACGRDNVKLLLDYWHLSTSGSTPEDIARLDKDLIAGLHICDSRDGDGSTHDDRDIWTGAGVIPLKHWTDAARSTGFNGWAAGELLSPKFWEQNPWEVSRRLRQHIEYILL
jgi:sugar phosphate isomerase/epimerase